MNKLTSLSLLFIVPLATLANDSKILSDTKLEIIELKQKQIEQKKQSNKYDWLSDINLNASTSTDEERTKTNDYSLSISQEIFNFGGITSQIDYSLELQKMESLALSINKKDDLNTLYSLLLDVKVNDISLKQNILHLKNSEISIRNKKSEYKAGELDISELNDAIMTKNGFSDTEKKLQLSKLININNIKKYTDTNYSKIDIPNIKLMSKDLYLKNASSVKYSKLDIQANNSLYKIKKSDYLPSLSITSKYGYQDTSISQGDDYYNYGLALSMPLSFTSSNDIEQTKLDYLISQQELSEELVTSESTYEESVLSIQNYQDRIKLAVNDIKLYDELLLTNEEEYKAGYKTIDDVETLKNSRLIRALDIQTYKLNIQQQILILYFKI
jgi:outer membrane protein TolC